MSFLNKLLFFISVPKCVCCQEKLDILDRCLCKRCRKEYEEQLGRNCPLCSLNLSSCRCSNRYLKAHSVKTLVKVYRYSREPEFKAGNSLIYSLKQDNRKDVKEFLTDALALSIVKIIEESKLRDYIITNVPRRRAGIIKYGYDHSKDLARLVAKKTNIEYKEILKSVSKSAQKEAMGKERLNNARFDYRVGKGFTLKGRRIILIDDVVTTGASMGNSAVLLKGLGAKEIIGATVSVAYKNN